MPFVKSKSISCESTVFYEHEQDTLMQSFSHYNESNLIIDIPDPVDSTLTEIESWCNTYSYDILILSCYGLKEGFLVFEDNKGEKILVSGKEVGQAIARLRHILFVIILSACHSAGPGDPGYHYAITM